MKKDPDAGRPPHHADRGGPPDQHRFLGGCAGHALHLDDRVRRPQAKASSTSSPGPAISNAARRDPAYDWVTAFEEATGCKVNVKVAGTSDEMVTLMNQGGFDLVTASGDASLRLIAGGTVQPVNVDLIPSWGTVDERLQNAPWHTVDGVHYGTPYQWGANVLMYNTETFPEAPDTVGRGLPGAGAARRPVQPGPRPGV
jgi:spermidine/putrescine-binding protein